MGRPLTIYRRHLGRCPSTLRTQKGCQCPVWVQGTLHGKWVKKAVGVRSWEAAQKLVREWESGTTLKSIALKPACDAFITEWESQKWSIATIKKYKLLMKELVAFFGGDLNVGRIDLSELQRYKQCWEMGPLSQRKKIERLRTFFNFCIESKWIRENPARVLQGPKVIPGPTLPFTAEEMEKILWATEVYPTAGIHGKMTPLRARAFVLLLRYSGMRIGDAATLARDRIQDGKLFLYTAKTKTPVHMPLPKEVIEALAKLYDTGKYYFWSGKGTIKAATSGMQRTLYRLFKLAGIKTGHAHRFRDTFSVSLLESGVSLETVSILLGHSNSKITAKHYNPWVKSRQIALENEIQKAWKLN